MNEGAIFFFIGLSLVILGIPLLIREKRLFENAETAQATVVDYEYKGHGQGGQTFMYAMAVEYLLLDGTRIHATEQKNSNHRKYAVGAEITVKYSKEKPDMFIVSGDHSRKIAMAGMIIAGVAMILLPVLGLI